MSLPPQITVRKATLEDANAIVEFVALEFNKSDARAAYEAKIRNSISEGLSEVVLDTTSNRFLGCHLISKWYRDSFKNVKFSAPSTQKAKIYHDLLQRVESQFWDLCPPDVNVVAYGVLLLFDPSIHRFKLGRKLAARSVSKEFLKANGLDGLTGMTSSNANYRNFLKLGTIVLAEIAYRDYFQKVGLVFKNDLPDGTTKGAFVFNPFRTYADYNPEIIQMRRQKAKL